MSSICFTFGAFLYKHTLPPLPTSLKILEISEHTNTFININCILNMNDLEKLTTHKVEEVTDAFLLSLAENCKKLYHLDITGKNFLTVLFLKLFFDLIKKIQCI